jgi:hypothetical protein
MPFLEKEIYKGLPDFIASHFCVHDAFSFMSLKKLNPDKISGLIRLITKIHYSIHRKSARHSESITGGCTADYGSRLGSSSSCREYFSLVKKLELIHFKYYTGFFYLRLACTGTEKR